MEISHSSGMPIEKQVLVAAVLAMGKGLIEFGSEVKRAEDTMNRIINNSNFLTADEKDATYVYVTINSIFFRNGGRDVDFTQIIDRDFNLDKVAKLNQLSRDYADQKVTIQELLTEINHVLIEKTPKQFSWLAYSLLSASITLILNGDAVECGLAAIIGLVTSQSYPFFKRYLNNKFLPEFLAAFIGGLMATVFCTVFKYDPTLLYTAAIIPMVPGIGLTNGVHDTFDDYFISGPVMILESLTTLISISLGITLVQVLPFGLHASGEINVVSVSFIAQIIGSAICSVSFAYIINVSRRLFVPVSIAGAITWLVYVWVTYLAHSSLLNTLISVGMLTLISQYFAKRYKAPMTIFFIPSLVALVPGITMFVGLSQLGIGQSTLAVTTFVGVIANLLGLTIGSIAGDEVYRIFLRLTGRLKGSSN
ncbi:threonine/serine exporter family protein [Lentilactobacillus sp. Marseille-Q4993]|uniref:threonine/serine ThrE exporter family protein n=1 Tax=Lentilactobacillus sp. Marseille-Q4993 TaxID=3039492 RepID=UPI0024BC46A3|nr:threonine/serine exporter family protein [Lentilactobacillus sp. Marseille-Q4993]